MRSNFTIVIVGQKKTGKTTLAKRLMSISKLPKKLVFDPSGQEAWQDLPRIKPKMLPVWKQGTKRLFENDTHEMLHLINEYVTDTFIIFDDATAYIEAILSQDLKTLLTRNRHKNNDVVLIFHSLRSVPPKVFEHTSHLILFKTNDTEQHLRRLDKVPNSPEILQAFAEVSRKYQKNPHANICITL